MGDPRTSEEGQTAKAGRPGDGLVLGWRVSSGVAGGSGDVAGERGRLVRHGHRRGEEDELPCLTALTVDTTPNLCFASSNQRLDCVGKVQRTSPASQSRTEQGAEQGAAGQRSTR